MNAPYCTITDCPKTVNKNTKLRYAEIKKYKSVITPLTPINKALDFIGVWHLKICTTANVIALLSFLVTGPLFALGAILHATGWASEPLVTLLTSGVYLSAGLFMISVIGCLLTFFWAVAIFNARPDLGAIFLCLGLVLAGWKLAKFIGKKAFNK